MNEFIAKKGLISQGNAQISGSLTVTNGITASISGLHIGNTIGSASTASYVAGYNIDGQVSSSQYADFALTTDTASFAWYAESSSYALSASYVDVTAFDNLVLAFEFKFSTNTSATDPGNGKFKYDNAASQSISNVYVSYKTNNGLDISGIINSLHSGSYNLYIQQKSDATKASIFQVVNENND